MDAIQERAAELAYQEGRATYERVIRAFEEVRPRLLSLFSAAGISAALVTGIALGAEDLDRVHWQGAIGIALILLGMVGMSAAVAGAWLPKEVAWGYDPVAVVQVHVDAEEAQRPQDLGDLYRDMALAAGEFVDAALTTWRRVILWVRVALWSFLAVMAGFAALLMDVLL